MKNRSKGFTMVELLVAMVIMGLLMVMAFPTMRAIQSRNEKKKYEEYGKSMVSAAKLYTDSYADDLFPRGYKNEFAKIYSEDLVSKDLLKNIEFKDVSCINGESFIVVAKYGDDYEYCLHLVCKPKKNPTSSTVLYQETNREGICQTYDTRKVHYIYNPSVNGINRPQVEYIDEIIKGDDAYHALSPSKFSGFNYANNHQKFKHWKDTARNKTYAVGDLVDSESLKSELTLYSVHRQYFYTVNYSCNSGTGTVASHRCDYDFDCTLRSNGCIYKGHTYLNWKDGSGKTYSPSTKYRNLVETDDGSITLGANWRINKIYILYNANGGTLTEPYLHDFKITSNLLYKNNNSKFFSVSYGAKIGDDGLINYNNTSYVNLRKTGYYITAGSEWNSNSNGSGTSYNQASNYDSSTFCDASWGDCDKTLYVNWKPKTITVNFNCNGGSGGGSQTFIYDVSGQSFNTSCTSPGYTFTGWNTRSDGSGSSYTLKNGVSNNWINTNSPSITLYAQWRPNILSIVYMANGGTLKSAHGDNITLNDDEVFSYGVSPYHKIAYGGTVNLSNYNNSDWLNLEKAGNTVTAGAEWNDDDGGDGKSFDHGKDYATTEFCDILSGDCEITLYVNWVSSSKITCPAGKYLKKGKKKCSKCKGGYYCSGGSWYYSNTVDQGLTGCPGNYSISAPGASAIGNCYRHIARNYRIKEAGGDPVRCSSGYSSSGGLVYYGRTTSCYPSKCSSTYTPEKNAEFKNCSPNSANIKMFKFYNSTKDKTYGIKFDMKVYQCTCELDSNDNSVCDATVKDVTTCHHTYNYAFILYTSNKWRNKAYDGDIPRNSHVKQVCDDTISSSNSPYSFHSYKWYNGAARDGWDDFTDDAYLVGRTTVIDASVGPETACRKACDLKY